MKYQKYYSTGSEIINVNDRITFKSKINFYQKLYCPSKMRRKSVSIDDSRVLLLFFFNLFQRPADIL